MVQGNIYGRRKSPWSYRSKAENRCVGRIVIRALSEASESVRMCEGLADSVLEAGKKSGTAES